MRWCDRRSYKLLFEHFIIAAAMRHKRTGKVENQNTLLASEFQLKQSGVQMHGSLHLELAAERYAGMLSHLPSP